LFWNDEYRERLAQAVITRRQQEAILIEQRERYELVRFLDKYGVPDGYVKETK
jgi:hypothetical protein